MSTAGNGFGSRTQVEILSQPNCWKECFQALHHGGELEKVRSLFSQDTECLFIGCGSSYYVSQAAAASWRLITGNRAQAIPASELLLYPDLVPTDREKCRPIMISRSGHSSEVVRAAKYLEKERNIRTLAISCSTDQPLERVASTTLYLRPADEKSVVMTRSFTSMLLASQSLAAFLSGRTDVTGGLQSLPGGVQPVLDSVNPRIREFVQANSFADYVFLAQGPFFGIASEGQLKVKEMSCSYAQVFHTLEFRHGPKAIVSPETLITFLISESAFDAERQVLEEIKDLGATTLVITNKADNTIRENADFLVELNLDAPESVRAVGYLVTCQLLGFYTGLKKGIDIDNPRNLSRAVILNAK